MIIKNASVRDFRTNEFYVIPDCVAEEIIKRASLKHGWFAWAAGKDDSSIFVDAFFDFAGGFEVSFHTLDEFGEFVSTEREGNADDDYCMAPGIDRSTE